MMISSRKAEKHYKKLKLIAKILDTYGLFVTLKTRIYEAVNKSANKKDLFTNFLRPKNCKVKKDNNK